MDANLILQVVLVLVPMILSLTVHEFAHAASAKWLGDDTAERMGRLTLNPVAHIDVIGTLVLPAALVLSGSGMFFGWAKPVPFDPSRFTRAVTARTGSMITASAGPVANVVLAIVSQAVVAAIVHGGLNVGEAMTGFLQRMVVLNVVLAVFNMIPIFPLDGQKVLSGLLPLNRALEFERFNLRYGSWVLLGIVFFGGSIIFTPVRWVLAGLAAVFGLT